MKKDYLTKLERWARWMLPAREAEEVLADYRDIVSDPELRQGLGKPRSVIRPLAQPRQYYAWLAVFAVMAVCILALGISGTAIGFPLWLYLFDGWVSHPYGAYLAALGAVVAMVWFRLKGRKGQRLSRAIPVLLAVLLACIGAVLLFCWGCSRDFDGFCQMWGLVRVWIGPNETAPASLYLSRIAMGNGAALIALAGLIALIKARSRDRRWAAVYVLAVTAILVALLTLDWSGRMDLTGTSYEELFRQMLTRCSVIAAVGVAATGVALC